MAEREQLDDRALVARVLEGDRDRFTELVKRYEKRVVSVGRDCRLTSDGYAAAVTEGLRSTGLTVLDIGVCPTPLMYFSLFQGEPWVAINQIVSTKALYNPFKNTTPELQAKIDALQTQLTTLQNTQYKAILYGTDGQPLQTVSFGATQPLKLRLVPLK